MKNQDKRNSKRAVASQRDSVYHALIEGLSYDKSFLDSLTCSEDDAIRGLVSDLLNPANRSVSISRLASIRKISPNALLELWRNFQVTAAMQTLSGGLPALCADIMVDAQSSTVVCEHCQGYGIIRADPDLMPAPDEAPAVMQAPRVVKAITISCPACGGSGSARKPGDTDSRKLVTEILGLTGKKGPMTQTNIQVLGGAATALDGVDALERSAGILAQMATPSESMRRDVKIHPDEVKVEIRDDTDPAHAVAKERRATIEQAGPPDDEGVIIDVIPEP